MEKSCENHPYRSWKNNVIKICMNYMLVSAIETMGELYAFAEKSEVDTSIVSTMLHSIYGHPTFQTLCR